MQRPVFIARQSSHPSGLLGWLIGWIMSYETADANARTLELLEIRPADRVLEVGFGHGRTLARALNLAAQGHVAGVEVSEDMKKMATSYNEAAIRQGRMELQRCGGPQMPYRDATFDRAYSVHTIYFWPDALPHLREIRRILAPGGRFVLTFHHGDTFAADLPAEVYTHRSPDQIVALLHAAGFDTVRVHEAAPLYFAIAAVGST